MNTRFGTLAALFAVSLTLPLALSGQANGGEPCACWPIDVGDGPTLDTKGKSPAQVARATLALLTPQVPVLARMEILRRAAVAIQGQPDVAEHVIFELCARVLDVESGKSQKPARAWFDAGYAVTCFRQTGMTNRMGYDWIAQAIRKAPAVDQGAMHYAAALATLMPHPRHARFVDHVKAMRLATANDALLAKNFSGFAKMYPRVLKHFAKDYLTNSTAPKK